jgi:hypothetical protein
MSLAIGGRRTRWRTVVTCRCDSSSHARPTDTAGAIAISPPVPRCPDVPSLTSLTIHITVHLQVPDLSQTFHITKYFTEFGIDVGLWSELGQTTVDLVDVPFPWGQYGPDGTPYNHNLYDTAQLFMQSWPSSSPALRAAMAQQSRHFLNFSLSMVEGAGNGAFPWSPYTDVSAESAMYFGTGTLKLFGYFDARDCFWSMEDPSECRVGRSYEQRRVLYDRMAANVFGKLADNSGAGDDYYDVLEKLGIPLPLPMRSDYDGPTNATLPDGGSRSSADFGIGVAVGVGITCGSMGLAALILRYTRSRSGSPHQDQSAKAPGSIQLQED